MAQGIKETAQVCPLGRETAECGDCMAASLKLCDGGRPTGYVQLYVVSAAVAAVWLVYILLT